MLLDKRDPSQFEELQRFILQRYGIEGSLQKLQGEEDDNFLLEVQAGSRGGPLKAGEDRCLVKVAKSGTEFDFLQFQVKILEHLEGKTTLNLPRVLPSLTQSLIEKIDFQGSPRLMRLLSWVPGRMFAAVKPRSTKVLRNAGSALGELTKALSGFDHPGAHRTLKWDPIQALWLESALAEFNSHEERELVEYYYDIYLNAQKLFAHLPHSVTHNDVNDYNLVMSDRVVDPDVSGIIDFGDAVHTHTICELAIFLAYAAMDMPDPISAAVEVIHSYHQIHKLEENELEVLFPLMAIRLVVSVTCAMQNRKRFPDQDYLFISEAPAWELLRRLRTVCVREVHYRFRQACGYAPIPSAVRFGQLFEKGSYAFHPVVEPPSSPVPVFDMTVGSLCLGNTIDYQDLQSFSRTVSRFMEDANAEQAIGRFGEIRPIYSTDQYLKEGNDGPVWRTVHLGLDLFSLPGTPVFAAYDGVVHQLRNNNREKDYGPTIILKHRVEEIEFFTLYGHLRHSCLKFLKEGQSVTAGEVIAEIGASYENGGWPPHLHFQIITDMLDFDGDYPGVAFPDQTEFWYALSPDPTELLGFSQTKGSEEPVGGLREKRANLLGTSLSLSYRYPLHIVRGSMQFLFDKQGRRYLDMVNNVAHVGHEHPLVVKAAQRQMAVLNTNTRYLHENLVHLAEELLKTLPPHLQVCHFVNSGSEANELALRMVETYSGRRDMLAFEGGYHGNTHRCIELSSYKFNGPGGQGKPDSTHLLPLPDFFRRIKCEEDYLSIVDHQFKTMQRDGVSLAGFLGESILSCGGQLPVPSRLMQAIYDGVHGVGGLCIADEIQTGLGRVGSHFWAFEQQGVRPDIVTIGKPLGNGHPIAAVVCTREVADRFNNGMEYFNTFGGNPVSCAIALSVLRCIDEFQLQENALRVGNQLIRELKNLQSSFSFIGDVRGTGLFLGFEIVSQDDGHQPDPGKASYLANRMRSRGVLLSCDGPDGNVLKLKPPMCFNFDDLDFLLDHLETVFREDRMQP